MVDAVQRYDRVCSILDEAAAGSEENYGGLGSFWQGGTAKLKDAVVFGVPMVASRAENSGLIKGLRGEAPFDGGRFPRLPWGGKQVSEADIVFIAEWIDDGCPEDAVQIDAYLEAEVQPALEAVAQPAEQKTCCATANYVIQEHEFGLFDGGVNAFAFGQTEVRQRANIDLLPEKQIDELRDAMRQIMDLNDSAHDRRSFKNQALIHQNHCQHGWERFLPWHRAYIYEFEENLRDFNSNVMMPYWDWTMAQYKPSTPDLGWRIPNALKAYLTTDQAKWLVGALHPAPTKAQRSKILELAELRTLFRTQSCFLELLYNTIGYTHVTPDPKNENRCRVIKALMASNPLWYPLRYPGVYFNKDGKLSTINDVIHYHYPTADDIRQIMSLNNFRDFGGGSMYNDSYGFLDQNPHNTMHIWTGGFNPYYTRDSYKKDDTSTRAPQNTAQSKRVYYSDDDLFSQPPNGDMFSNLTASYDPVFWPVHSNVDRLWWQWQQNNPHGSPQDLDAVLTPWSYTVRDTQSIEPFGYEYVRGAYLMPVGYAAPIGRFVSKEIPVPEGMAEFSRAEVRLHRVPVLTESCIIRVFLNDPAADVSTAVEGNPHFAGYVSIFSHGECIGGPGHCAIPNPRPGDQRERPHNTPRNHRIDVTQAARRMLEDSKTLRVTLVVLGAGDDVILKTEGVTLTFLD
ncbi:MAG: tyrosinase family protein [Rhodospirillales bacterium]|nr:tyrosinase family protein [Rhodospirillales bacterium]